ncbi:MAG: hypothetical protein ACK546_01110 [bacterium]
MQIRRKFGLAPVALTESVQLCLSCRENVLEYIDFCLSSEETLALNIFLEEYKRLCGSMPIIEGVQVGIGLMGSRAGQRSLAVVSDVELPGEDALAILLLRLRPFILEREPGSFARAMSIIGRHLDQADIRSLLKDNWSLYNGKSMQAQVRLESSGAIVNSESRLWEWLNAYEYHCDLQKRESIDELLRGSLGELPMSLWIWHLLDKLCAIHNAAGIVELILGHIEEYHFGEIIIRMNGFPQPEGNWPGKPNAAI